MSSYPYHNPYENPIELKRIGILLDDDDEPCMTNGHEDPHPRAEFVHIMGPEADEGGIPIYLCAKCHQSDTRDFELYKREIGAQ